MLPPLELPEHTDSKLSEDFTKYKKSDYFAAIRISRRFRKGDGVEKNLDKAIEIMREVLKHGDRSIFGEYIDMLILRNGPGDREKAYDLCIGSASAGNNKSMARLAGMFRNGYGTDQNAVYADIWYMLAVKNGADWMKKEYAEFLLSQSKPNRLKEIPDVKSLVEPLDRTPVLLDYILNENILTVLLPKSCRELNTEFIVGLYCDGILIEKKKISSEAKFELKKSGVYYVTADRKQNIGIVLSTEPFNYFTDFDEQVADDFFGLFENLRVPKLYKSNYPFSDFAVVPSEFAEGKCVSGLFSKELVFGDKRYTVLSTALFDNVLFSGYMVNDGKLVWGSEELGSGDTVGDYSDHIGCFTVLTSDPEKIAICNDYFGFGKIYSYSCGEEYIFSNNYYLLVRLIQVYGIKYSVDYKTASLYLSQCRGMIFDQPFDSALLVKKTEFLDIGRSVIISETGVEFADTDILQAVNKSIKSDYGNAVKQSAEEIRNTLFAFISSPHFDKFAVDLTGGMDSRLVVAALSGIETDKKIFLASGGKQEEVICATNIAESFGFVYSPEYIGFRRINYGCSLPVNSPLSEDEYVDLIIGSEFGRFDPSTLFSTLRLKNCMHITGCAGEIISRPYMSCRLFGATASSDPIELAEKYVLSVNKNCINGNKNIFRETVKRLGKSLSDNSGNNIFRKCEQMLLQYRSRFHFDLAPKISYSTFSCTPLLSKTAFAMLYSSLENNAEYSFVYDLMAELNHDISQYRYESLKDNVGRILHDKEKPSKIVYSDKIAESYISALENSKNIQFVFGDHKIKNWSNSPLYEALFRRLCENSAYVLKYASNEFSKQWKLPLWHEIERLKNAPRDQNYIYELTGMLKKISTLAILLNPKSKLEITEWHPTEMEYSAEDNTYWYIDAQK